MRFILRMTLCPPVAVDDTVDIAAGTQTIAIPVLANDSDADTASLATKQPVVRFVTLPTHRIAVVQADRSVCYTPPTPPWSGRTPSRTWP